MPVVSEKERHLPDLACDKDRAEIIVIEEGTGEFAFGEKDGEEVEGHDVAIAKKTEDVWRT